MNKKNSAIDHKQLGISKGTYKLFNEGELSDIESEKVLHRINLFHAARVKLPIVDVLEKVKEKYEFSNADLALFLGVSLDVIKEALSGLPQPRERRVLLKALLNGNKVKKSLEEDIAVILSGKFEGDKP
jgi:hypothetical protein